MGQWQWVHQLTCGCFAKGEKQVIPSSGPQPGEVGLSQTISFRRTPTISSRSPTLVTNLSRIKTASSNSTAGGPNQRSLSWSQRVSGRKIRPQLSGTMSDSSPQGRILAATVHTTYEQSEGPRSPEGGGHNGREPQGNLEDEDSELEDDDSERVSPPWIPLSEVKHVISAAEDELKTLQLSRVDPDRLQTFISKAQRLCALLIHIDRLHWIEAFCEQNFGDATFPVKIVQKNKNTCTVRRLKTKATLSEASVDIHIAKPDDRTIIHTIEDPHQWFFFPPVFAKSGSPYTFDSRCRLPFLKEITHRATNFSAVTERVIHKSHLDFPKFPNDDQIVGYL